ncbi:MAG: penicillin-binding transpeptidase domain-containing protein [Candidatus Omnitrophota bacterium]
MHINFSKTRHFSVLIVFCFLFAILLARLLYIQILRHTYLSDLADKQHKLFLRLEPQRGNVYDRRNRVLAIYMDAPSIYAVPKEISDKENSALILAEKLDIDKEKLLRKFKKDNYFAWVKRKVDSETAGKIEELRMQGLYPMSEHKRFYPGGKLLCHVLGMTGIDNEGLEGIELYYDRELKGKPGWRLSSKDAKKREVVSFQRGFVPAREGKSIVLTLDEVIQHIIEKELENLVRRYRPKAVSIVALDPASGEILGLANYPWFDPNDISGVNASAVRNRAITDSFEPGSVFKVVTASAALEEKIVDFDSEFYCENGAYKIGKRTLHDYRPYGTLKFREIIERSSNIGTVKVAGKLGREKLAAYIKRFNFGEATGIDLPGEATGIMRNPSSWTPVDMTTIPMGQGIAVTALQLASCVGVIANGGVLMRPYVAKKLLDEEGNAVWKKKPDVIRRVISEETAGKVKRLLAGVIERGTGRRARLENFRACGKTGTAEKVNPKGGYYKQKYISSFIGFAPYERPAVALAICVDEPRGEHFGSRVAAPAFKRIMEKILPYMGVESDKGETGKSS